ncbi:thermonuclease family protein [Virgibacillus salexigens]|uniref:thermonuclease family protein n=1 Tax=Virgibacillus salexigens TaxID=61016 RepID=UPI0030818917
MKKLIILFLFTFLLVGCDELDTILKDNAAATETEEMATDKEKVTIDRVVDGDTVKVEFPSGETETVRLLLIDSPESVHVRP